MSSGSGGCIRSRDTVVQGETTPAAVWYHVRVCSCFTSRSQHKDLTGVVCVPMNCRAKLSFSLVGAKRSLDVVTLNDEDYRRWHTVLHKLKVERSAATVAATAST